MGRESEKKGTPRGWYKGSSLEQKVILMKKIYKMRDVQSVAHHLQTNLQPVLNCGLQPLQVPWLYMLSVAPCGPGYPFIQLGPAALALAVSPPSLLCPPALLLPGLKNPCLSVSSAQQHLKHQCVISLILILNPKYTIVIANRKKSNSWNQNTFPTGCWTIVSFSQNMFILNLRPGFHSSLTQ